MKKIMDFLKKQPLITGIIAVIFITLSVRFLGPRMANNFESGVFRFAYTFAGMVFLFLISGEKAFEKSCRTTGYIIKVTLPFLIFPALGTAIAVVKGIIDKDPVSPNWPIRLLARAFLFLSVGLMEEVMARGIINDALIYQFRDKKKLFLMIAVLDVIIFGAVHIIGSQINTPMAVVMAVMKTLSTGIWGLAFLMLYWKTRNIWGIAISHGLFDFIASIGDTVFNTAKGAENTTQDYVSLKGELGNTTFAVYVISLIINIIIVTWMWKKHMKDVDFEEIRKSW